MKQLWKRNPNVYGLVLFALIIGSLPLVVKSPYLLSTAIFIGIATILTLGLCLLMGYAGQISLGHAAFYGIGAYASAILTVKLSVYPWLALLLGIFITGTTAYLIGSLIFRLREHYLAVATLGLGIVVFLAFGEFPEWTGGSSGLPGVSFFGSSAAAVGLGGVGLSFGLAASFFPACSFSFFLYSARSSS